MLEDVLIKDIEARGGNVQRNSPFISVSKTVDGSGELEVTYEDRATATTKVIRTKYLVGCDGARSKVRDFIPGAQLEGEMSNASWGVLDGIHYFIYLLPLCLWLVVKGVNRFMYG